MERGLLKKYLLNYIMFGVPVESFEIASVNLNKSEFDQRGLISEVVGVVRKQAENFLRRERGVE